MRDPVPTALVCLALVVFFLAIAIAAGGGLSH